MAVLSSLSFDHTPLAGRRRQDGGVYAWLMSTPHIAAAPGDFSDVCLLPGDPLRARYLAERFLDDAALVTAVRNMEGYTGMYRGRRISVMGTGMGIPSTLIYTTELIREYGVTSLLRLGSAGGIAPDLEIRDLVIAAGASTDSNANRVRFGGFDFAAIADFGLTRLLVEAAEAREVAVRVGNVVSSDQFYHPEPGFLELARRMGILAVEMEAAGRAGAILAVTDIVEGDEGLSSTEREQTLDEMITVALEAAVRI